jgi:SAM-dependent methyltransferase
MTVEGSFPATSMPNTDWWSSLWPRPAQVLTELGIEIDLDVVDLCCGDGHFTAAIAQRASRTVAIDIDPQTLELAREKVSATGASHCTFIKGEAYDIAALVPWLVDVVFMANTFHGVPDKERLGRAVAAVLKPNGRFIVINWHRRPREETQVLGKPRGPKTETRVEAEEAAAALATSGLQLERIVELPPYHYGAIFIGSAMGGP